jgi:hypothetical protein
VGEVSPWPCIKKAHNKAPFLLQGTPPPGCGRVPAVARFAHPLGAPAENRKSENTLMRIENKERVIASDLPSRSALAKAGSEAIYP